MSSQNDQICFGFRDVVDDGVQRAAFAKAPDDFGVLMDQIEVKLLKFHTCAAPGFFLKRIHGRKFIRSETICSISGFRLYHME